MNYYKIKPEVPAGIGPNTVFDVISGGKRVKNYILFLKGGLEVI